MTRDPVVAHIRKPLRDKIGFWVAVLAIGIACLSVLNVSNESKRRTQQLQDVICGVYVPIGNSVLPSRVSPLGKTIVAATRHGAISIHCPGVSK